MIKLHVKLNVIGEFFPYVSVLECTDTEKGHWKTVMDFTSAGGGGSEPLAAFELYLDAIMHHNVDIHVDAELESIAHVLAQKLLLNDHSHTTAVGFDDEGAPFLITPAGTFQSKRGEHFLHINAR